MPASAARPSSAWGTGRRTRSRLSRAHDHLVIGGRPHRDTDPGAAAAQQVRQRGAERVLADVLARGVAELGAHALRRAADFGLHQPVVANQRIPVLEPAQAVQAVEHDGELAIGLDLLDQVALGRQHQSDDQVLAQHDREGEEGEASARVAASFKGVIFQILLLELSGATLLLLDEPTDNFDVQSAEALEEALIRPGVGSAYVSYVYDSRDADATTGETLRMRVVRFTYDAATRTLPGRIVRDVLAGDQHERRLRELGKAAQKTGLSAFLAHAGGLNRCRLRPERRKYAKARYG